MSRHGIATDRVKSGNFRHQVNFGHTSAKSGNLDSMALNKLSHQDSYCLLCLCIFIPRIKI